MSMTDFWNLMIVILKGKGDFADVIRLRALRWDCPRLSCLGPKGSHSVVTKGWQEVGVRGEGSVWTEKQRRERYTLKMEEATAKEYWWSPEAEKGKEVDSPLRASKMNQPCKSSWP